MLHYAHQLANSDSLVVGRGILEVFCSLKQGYESDGAIAEHLNKELKYAVELKGRQFIMWSIVI